MGVVYLARDVQLDRHVAIKVLPLHLAEQPEARERFLSEARTAAGLSHPHVVPIHRVGEASGSPSDNRTAICDHTSGNGRRARCVTHCVFSLRYGRLRVTLRGRDGLWPAIVAMALTSASFASVLLSIRQPGAWWVANSPLARNPTSERVVFFTLRQKPQRVAALRPALPRRPDRVRAPSARSGVAQPLDAGVTQPPAATATTPAQVRHEPLSQLTPWPLPPRLVSPRPRNTPWYSVRARRSPFGLADTLVTVERDSILRALGGEIPELAVRRGQTHAERDASAKEAMLKMRLSGRILLVPPDNSGGLITSSLPLPLFGAGASRVKRASESRALDEIRNRLARLGQRADSLRRSRVDSLPR